MDYKGYIEITLNEEKLTKFYENTELYVEMYNLKENEYLLVKDESGKVIDIYCYQNKLLRRVNYNVINNKYAGVIIKPRNTYQQLAIDLLQNRESKIKLIRGVYGSGKDLLMMHQALSLVEKNKFDSIIFIRPNVTVANVPDIGYLKGDSDEKLEWTLGPLFDKVGGKEGITYLKENGKLETQPLLYIRGRSFENSIVYVTEGQNITSEIAKLIISRIGENSELWINGDTHQTDKKVYEQDNGIIKMIERLSGNHLFGYVYLPLTERSEVANLANLLDD